MYACIICPYFFQGAGGGLLVGPNDKLFPKNNFEGSPKAFFLPASKLIHMYIDLQQNHKSTSLSQGRHTNQISNNLGHERTI